MTQEIEIEFKNLLTKSEFLKLSEALCMKEHDFKQQVNHYFDTKDFSLKQKISTPHPRKDGAFVLTLKNLPRSVCWKRIKSLRHLILTSSRFRMAPSNVSWKVSESTQNTFAISERCRPHARKRIRKRLNHFRSQPIFRERRL